MLKILCLTLLLKTAFAGVLPVIPEGCFDNGGYCIGSIDVKEPLYGVGSPKKMMKINLFAKLYEGNYDGPEAILGKYFNFEKWVDYVGDGVVYENSFTLPSFVNEQGKEVKQHYAHYTVKGPLGIRPEVKSVTQYWQIDAFEGALVSYQFDNPVDHVAIPVPQLNTVFNKGIGFDHNVGLLHVSEKLYDEGEDEYYFVVYYQGLIKPDNSIFWDTATKVTMRSIAATFKGMFLNSN